MTGCLNGGSCLFEMKTETFACSCRVPWIGDKCEKGEPFFSLFVKRLHLSLRLPCSIGAIFFLTRDRKTLVLMSAT